MQGQAWQTADNRHNSIYGQLQRLWIDLDQIATRWMLLTEVHLCKIVAPSRRYTIETPAASELVKLFAVREMAAS